MLEGTGVVELVLFVDTFDGLGGSLILKILF